MNSSIFEATDSKLSQILGVSRQTAGRYKKVFEREGWIIKHSNGTIAFNKVSKVLSVYIDDDRGSYSKRANLYLKVKGVRLKDLIIKLKYLIVKQKEINTHYVLELRRDLHNLKSKRELKSIMKKFDGLRWKPIPLSGEIDYRLQISYNGLSKLLDCSVGSAYNLIKKMRSNGLLEKYKRQEVMAKGVPAHVWETILQYRKEYSKCFYAYGNIIRNHCNKYNLIA